MGITVPLQIMEFYLLLNAVNPALGGGMFWRTLIGTIVMLGACYCGLNEDILTRIGDRLSVEGLTPTFSFKVGMAGWAFVLYETIILTRIRGLLSGLTQPARTAYNKMSLIVTFFWAIFPLGYYFGYLHSDLQEEIDHHNLNFTCNIADIVIKIAFCKCVLSAAKASSEEPRPSSPSRSTLAQPLVAPVAHGVVAPQMVQAKVLSGGLVSPPRQRVLQAGPAGFSPAPVLIVEGGSPYQYAAGQVVQQPYQVVQQPYQQEVAPQYIYAAP